MTKQHARSAATAYIAAASERLDEAHKRFILAIAFTDAEPEDRGGGAARSLSQRGDTAMMTKPDPNRCQKRVFSGQRWDYAGHQCTRKPVKDGFCGTHQPDAVDTRRAKAEAKWRKKRNMTMRKSIGASFAPALAEALHQLLDLPLTADRKKIEALLHKYDAEMKQHED